MEGKKREKFILPKIKNTEEVLFEDEIVLGILVYFHPRPEYSLFAGRMIKGASGLWKPSNTSAHAYFFSVSSAPELQSEVDTESLG